MDSPRVLIVDDSATIRKSAQFFLAGMGLELVFAEDGYAALKALQEATPPALILADVLMPRLNGYQLCALIKRQEKYKDIPFYVVSSKEGDVDKAYANLCGVQGYLVKPFQKEQLRASVKDALNLAEIF